MLVRMWWEGAELETKEMQGEAYQRIEIDVL